MSVGQATDDGEANVIVICPEYPRPISPLPVVQRTPSTKYLRGQSSGTANLQSISSSSSDDAVQPKLPTKYTIVGGISM